MLTVVRGILMEYLTKNFNMVTSTKLKLDAFCTTRHSFDISLQFYNSVLLTLTFFKLPSLIGALV